jgi:hypothetical protein
MYFPKSQITPNLYTNGEDLYIKYNGALYTGYYYKVSNGKYFSGKTPQDKPNYELIKGNPVTGLAPTRTSVVEYVNTDGEYFSYPTDFSLDSYPLFKNRNLNQVAAPVASPTLPSDQDYTIGEFRRFFCKKINETIYVEINKDYFNKLRAKDSGTAFEYYQPFNIPWQLTGNKEQVFTTNRNITALTIKQQKLPQFDKYLKEDYIKYYK